MDLGGSALVRQGSMGWEIIYQNESLRDMIKIARSKKKETGNAIKIIWR